jgi:hypothetical protein
VTSLSTRREKVETTVREMVTGTVARETKTNDGTTIHIPAALSSGAPLEQWLRAPPFGRLSREMMRNKGEKTTAQSVRHKPSKILIRSSHLAFSHASFEAIYVADPSHHIRQKQLNMHTNQSMGVRQLITFRWAHCHFEIR